MLNQKLKKFYSLLMPGKKASTASDTKNIEPASPETRSNSLKSARVLYRGDNQDHNASYEKATAAGNDWWIN